MMILVLPNFVQVEALLLSLYSSAVDVDSLYALSGRATALSTDQVRRH
jgi:hypothetical protein